MPATKEALKVAIKITYVPVALMIFAGLLLGAIELYSAEPSNIRLIIFFVIVPLCSFSITFGAFGHLVGGSPSTESDNK